MQGILHYYGAMTLVHENPFEQLATPMLWLDTHLQISDCNSAFSSWLGIGKRRLLGVSIKQLDQDHNRVQMLCQRSRELQLPTQAQRIRISYADRTERFADVLVQALDSGWCVEWHPRAEFAGEDPAITLPAALSVALQGLAHELRNPLAGLIGAAQLLQKRVAAQPQAQVLVQLIENEAVRLNHLIDQFMNPAPPKAHTVLNIHSVLETVRTLTSAEAGWAVRIERDYDPSLPELHGDADRLTQALLNLVRNALQSGASMVTLRSRAEHQVKIAEQLHKMAVRIEVVDNGQGVPEALYEQIFLPLVSSRAQGSGLGLPLAQQIAREHYGSLSFRSRVGHTVFTVLLPVLEHEDA